MEVGGRSGALLRVPSEGLAVGRRLAPVARGRGGRDGTHDGVAHDPEDSHRGKFIYTFEPEGSGMPFTLEHIPGGIGKVPIVGGAIENFITHRYQKFVDDFRRTCRPNT